MVFAAGFNMFSTTMQVLPSIKILNSKEERNWEVSITRDVSKRFLHLC
jgi:hypothetical protein